MKTLFLSVVVVLIVAVVLSMSPLISRTSPEIGRSAGGGPALSGSPTNRAGVLGTGAIEGFERKMTMPVSVDEKPGSKDSLLALLNGEATVAIIARPLTREEKKQGLLGYFLVYDDIAVLVHKNNPVDNLSKRQLREIFRGEIQNWSEVGGRDAPIIPVIESDEKEMDTSIAFRRLAMDGVPFAGNSQVIADSGEQVSYVAGDENGICYVSLGFMEADSALWEYDVKTLTVNGAAPSTENTSYGAYPIARPLSLVSRGLPKGKTREFVRYLVIDEGQRLLSRNFAGLKASRIGR